LYINKRDAFTMIELVFVIVVLGILASIAVPKFAATRDDAHIAKGRSDVAAIRSAIVSERQNRLFRGQTQFINRLDAGVAQNANGVAIFDNNGSAANTLLQYGIITSNTPGGWQVTGNNQYTFFMPFGNAVFTYCPNVAGVACPVAGVFDCVGGAGTTCAMLTD
jgi:general secretion pathway protein G